jgi:flagellar basal body rod protein FlgC
MSSLTGIALSGLQSATSAFNVSSARIAAATSDVVAAQALDSQDTATTAPASTLPQPTLANDAQAASRLDSTLVGLASQPAQPDLAQALTDQTAAAAAYRANLASLRTADQVSQATLDLKA